MPALPARSPQAQLMKYRYSAMPGDRLTLTTMMGQSNDWFYGPSESGIELFKDGKAISGDITAQIILWDVGTEADQEPGIGPDQGPRQKDPTRARAENGWFERLRMASPIRRLSM